MGVKVTLVPSKTRVGFIHEVQEEHELILDNTDLIGLLRIAGYEIPDDVDITIRTPDGPLSSVGGLDQNPIRVGWKVVKI